MFISIKYALYVLTCRRREHSAVVAFVKLKRTKIRLEVYNFIPSGDCRHQFLGYTNLQSNRLVLCLLGNRNISKIKANLLVAFLFHKSVRLIFIFSLSIRACVRKRSVVL